MNFVKPSTDEVIRMIDAALKFDHNATKGKEGVYQFNLTGNDGGVYQMIVEKSGARAVKGEENVPQVTLTMDHEHFKQLIEGTLNPTAAFMSGKLKIRGNMGLALKLQTVLQSFSF